MIEPLYVQHPDAIVEHRAMCVEVKADAVPQQIVEGSQETLHKEGESMMTIQKDDSELVEDSRAPQDG